MVTGKLTKIIENNLPSSAEDKRNYIGASNIGSDCLRQLWYQYKGYEGIPLTAKQRRTFEIGRRLEGMVIQLLRDAGLHIATIWYDLSDPELDYFQGHVDAVWCDKDSGEDKAIIEVKTAKDSSFKQFVNQGLKHWNKSYYAQLQAYMGMSEIFSAYILVLNKDNSDIFDELVTFDAEYYETLQFRARIIHEAKEAPCRVSNNPSWWLCKMCKFKEICHK